jgi:hypothetical protein
MPRRHIFRVARGRSGATGRGSGPGAGAPREGSSVAQERSAAPGGGMIGPADPRRWRGGAGGLRGEGPSPPSGERPRLPSVPAADRGRRGSGRPGSGPGVLRGGVTPRNGENRTLRRGATSEVTSRACVWRITKVFRHALRRGETARNRRVSRGSQRQGLLPPPRRPLAYDFFRIEE